MKISVDVTLSPEETATIFWSFDSTEQALFFSELARIVRSPTDLKTQLRSAITDDKMDMYGLFVLRCISEVMQEITEEEVM